MDHLDKLSDRALDEVFAVRVSRWKPGHISRDMNEMWEEWTSQPWTPAQLIPHYTHYIDSVMPWLDRVNYRARSSPTTGCIHHQHNIEIWTWHTNEKLGQGYARTFARAAMIALIRSERDAGRNSLWEDDRLVRKMLSQGLDGRSI